jgi:hypothetical protein
MRLSDKKYAKYTKTRGYMPIFVGKMLVNY